MPNNMVIDISHHNAGTLNFTQAKNAGVVGVICKATQGSGYKDPTYNARKTAAVNAGLLWGAYHFGTAANVNAQLANFMAVAGNDPTMLYALDFERNEATPSNTMTLPQARDFLQKLDARLGRKAVVYGGNLLKTALGNNPNQFFGQHRLWWAQYGESPHVPPTWNQAWLWQFTDGHHGPQPHTVNGIGSCDIDHYAGTAAQLKAQWPG
jgi:lysozyme